MSAQEGKNEEVINVSFEFMIGDWELFQMACKKVGRENEEILRAIAVKWAEDVLKAEQLPPG
ncbi:MAG TPA: hypothetical protein VLB01_05045 [Thermodesulfobacteriota bacterium]|nr:hypothetical protein [Thermodesulfobacteriota bacterium]